MNGFEKRLRRDRADIRIITMDLGHAFASWARENLPGATVVHDHFHVIKLMNEGLDRVRRKTMAGLEGEERKELKGQRHLFLRNEEEMARTALEHLESIKAIAGDLAVMHTMKEDLRASSTACDSIQAKQLLNGWIASARACAIDVMARMADTVERRLEGIAAFWDGRLSNSHRSWFNSKLRGLLKLANGYRNDEFFKLKIYDLPDQKIIDLTSPPPPKLAEMKRQSVWHSTSYQF